jgi:hypothetical protein
MKFFLNITALFEFITGLGLLFIPKLIILILLGTALDGAGAYAYVFAMVVGGALISIAYACWLIWDGVSKISIIKALLLYNSIVVAIFFLGL